MRVLAVIAVLLGATEARADVENDEIRGTARFALGGGVTGGVMAAGDTGIAGGGVELQGMVRWRLIHVVGQVSLVGKRHVDAEVSTLRPGSLTRVSLAARYQLGSSRADSSGTVGLWMEAGAGRQRIRWREGGRLTRPDLHFGLGVHVHGGSTDSRDKRHHGLLLGMRALWARAPRSHCSAGCTRNDFGVLATLAYTFGRRGR